MKATADLTARVLRTGTCLVAAMSAGAWWLSGAPAAAGVGGGGAIALINFRWLALDLGRAFAAVAEGGAGLSRIGRMGLRQLVMLGALGLLVAQGWVHPVGVGLGLAALPPALLIHGLLNARDMHEEG